MPSPPGFHPWRLSARDAVTASYEYNPDAAHTWITAIEKPIATFDLMNMCEPHFAALDAKLVEAINTLLSSRNDDLARQLVNVKEAAVKKEAGRLKGSPKSSVLFKMIVLIPSHVGQRHDAHRRKYCRYRVEGFYFRATDEEVCGNDRVLQGVPAGPRRSRKQNVQIPV